MSSNDLETTSRGHTISGETTVDVPDQDEVNSLPPVHPASNPKELGDIIAVIPNGEKLDACSGSTDAQYNRKTSCHQSKETQGSETRNFRGDQRSDAVSKEETTAGDNRSS